MLKVKIFCQTAEYIQDEDEYDKVLVTVSTSRELVIQVDYHRVNSLATTGK